MGGLGVRRFSCHHRPSRPARARKRAKPGAPSTPEITRYHVAGSPEARTIARVIPPTFSAMVERAGQDNNHLQKAVNVHESAFTWVRRYKTSNTLSKKRRLKDLLLPGTAAVFQAIPSGPRLTHLFCHFFLREKKVEHGRNLAQEDDIFSWAPRGGKLIETRWGMRIQGLGTLTSYVGAIFVGRRQTKGASTGFCWINFLTRSADREHRRHAHEPGCNSPARE